MSVWYIEHWSWSILSLDFISVQCSVIALGISRMFVWVGSKIMVSGKVILGAHVQIRVVFVVEYGIDGSNGGHADGTGGKPGISVGVVG